MSGSTENDFAASSIRPSATTPPRWRWCSSCQRQTLYPHKNKHMFLIFEFYHIRWTWTAAALWTWTNSWTSSMRTIHSATLIQWRICGRCSGEFWICSIYRSLERRMKRKQFPDIWKAHLIFKPCIRLGISIDWFFCRLLLFKKRITLLQWL